MQPFPGRPSVACPWCGSLQVSVPWDLIQSVRRRRLSRSGIVLWVTYPAWLLAALLTDLILLWALPLLIYIAASAVLLINLRRSSHSNLCFPCNGRWPASGTTV